MMPIKKFKPITDSEFLYLEPDEKLDFLLTYQDSTTRHFETIPEICASIWLPIKSENTALLPKKVIMNFSKLVKDSNIIEHVKQENGEYKQWTTFALIFGGIAAGVYYVVELVKLVLR
jgi:hypothetical protein